MDNDGAPPVFHVQVTYWQPAGVERFLAASAQNYVGLMRDGRTVLKYPSRKTDDGLQCLREEAERYIRLGPHENLVTYKGCDEENGLLLEYCERGSLQGVHEEPPDLTNSQKTTIGKQIVRGLAHLHERSFIHCDIHVRSVFMTSDMTAKIGDFQGQLYRPDGSVEWESMSQENAKSRHPHAGEHEFSPCTDIFALGTLLYQLWHGHPPFPELDEHADHDSIQARYRIGQYPIGISQGTDIDTIIGKCWTSKYQRDSEILDDMDELGEQKLHRALESL